MDPLHYETRRVVKNNLKGCNGIIPMASVVFQTCGIYHFLHGKEIPPISVDFYGTGIFWDCGIYHFLHGKINSTN